MSGERKKLFFIAGMAPTEKELQDAARLGFEAFRNASLVFPDSPFEAADEVAGLVPAAYRGRKGCVIREVPADPAESADPVEETDEPTAQPKGVGKAKRG